MSETTGGTARITESETRSGIFAGSDPYALARAWMAEAEKTEPNDPTAVALATADAGGLPNVRMVLLKEVEESLSEGGFVFYTNFESAKGGELAENPQAAMVMHWKSLRRQVRVRGPVERVGDAQADAYYASRAYKSRIGAWASAQSRPLSSRASLMADVAGYAARYPINPPRPPHWGGFRIRPVEMEFWADGEFRLHNRFRWRREAPGALAWAVQRLNP
ncbi:pyridoxamine 5'-phosphate oxidase [Paralimibaculum aggregatum]|uniref:Pyridoxine/pyridoxamine 5'-phosphate oxidase n=1 Tax=Paralimibaculum aggregatum TaxID=3036245 RepID=A0ABQ6LK13_9RHOB|nr:pyridoxamine 5'-phosphate oxidase [Limibaculum sp. NKW23]GMG83596.1 pyridoxamine 5'-phosphate oxidase [Limibaculum sp. NKW23]